MWQSNQVEVNGLNLHYIRTGGDKPPMLLLHGITDLGMCWEDVARVLEASYDLIIPDVRGHGSSDAPDANDTFKPLVDDVHGLIQALGIEKPVLFGHSLGAITSLSLAMMHPDVPRAIILEDPPPWWMPMKYDPEAAQQRARDSLNSIRSIKDKSIDELVEMQRAESPKWSDTELKNWAESKRQVSLGVPALFASSDYMAWDWKGLLPQVNCPTLLLTAEVEQGAIVTDEAADYLKTLMPQLVVEHIADAGHSIHREQFTTVMDAINQFLQSLD